jgi:radical SAM superfamily enzyme YgiQ (UPF0313 family)
MVWQKNGRIIENKQDYVVNQEIISEIDYSHLNLISNYQVYNKIFECEHHIDKAALNKIKRARSYFFYNPGRGCPVNCSYCGGSNISQILINKRKNVVMKSHQSVLRDLENLKKYSIDTIYTCFDPWPEGDYYVNLFEKIRKRKMSFNMCFECFSLPTREFIDSFLLTFGKKSSIVLSPDSGSERIRKLNKGFFYTNAELMDVLDYFYGKSIMSTLYFAAGFPFEELDDVKETMQLMSLIKTRYKGFFELAIMPILIDPGSPMWLDNKKYRIDCQLKTFKDLYEKHKSFSSNLGYRTENFSNEEIVEMVDFIKRDLH